MGDDALEMFSQRYQSQDTPWDTGITPPEIVAIVSKLAPGKALDAGCGTGTNLHYLLQHGWQVDGIDFVPQAIERAQARLRAFPASAWSVYCHDVARLNTLSDLRAPYDLVLDIGCGHGLPVSDQERYVQNIAVHLKTAGVWMLYAHQPTPERTFGWTPEDVQRLTAPYFSLTWQVLSNDTRSGMPSAWYRLARL